MENLLNCTVVEFCPSCKSVQPMRNSRYEREEKGPAERTKTVVTRIFHCGSCGSFVRSEEQELVEAGEAHIARVCASLEDVKAGKVRRFKTASDLLKAIEPEKGK